MKIDIDKKENYIIEEAKTLLSSIDIKVDDVAYQREENRYQHLKINLFFNGDEFVIVVCKNIKDDTCISIDAKVESDI